MAARTLLEMKEHLTQLFVSSKTAPASPADLSNTMSPSGYTITVVNTMDDSGPNFLVRNLVGAGLVLLALLTLFAFFAPHPDGTLTYYWVRSVRALFGWGGILVAVLLVIAGTWLIWPRLLGKWSPTWVQCAGAATLVVGGLTLAHHSVMQHTPVGTVYVDTALIDYPTRDMWAEAIACPFNPNRLVAQGYAPALNAPLNTFDVARCGLGGGYTGALVQSGLNRLLGEWGVALLAPALMVLGALMMLKMSASQFIAALVGGSATGARRRIPTPGGIVPDGRREPLRKPPKFPMPGGIRMVGQGEIENSDILKNEEDDEDTNPDPVELPEAGDVQTNDDEVIVEPEADIT